MNKSEELVYQLCKKSFLSLWSYPTPRGKKGKELCDILVVCEPDILIFSVKEVEFKDTGNRVGFQRWQRDALEASFRQIYGAEKWINSNTNVITASGKLGLPFSEISKRRIHRIAVALGSKGKVSMHFGDSGKGFIHVFDEVSLDVIMTELDTITDFVKYLRDKENYYRKGKDTFFIGEENLLTVYLSYGKTFPDEPTFLALDDDLWDGFKNNPIVIAKKKSDEISYAWDTIIEEIHQTYLDSNFIVNETFTSKLSEIEKALRIMAKEDRYARRRLSKSLVEFIQNAKSHKLKSRMKPNSSSMTDVIYVFQISDYDSNRESNFNELQLRCVVAKGLNKDRTKVLGMLFEFSTIVEGSATSLCLLEINEWSSDWQEKMERIQSEVGYFTNSKVSKISSDEYTTEYPECTS